MYFQRWLNDPDGLALTLSVGRTMYRNHREKVVMIRTLALVFCCLIPPDAVAMDYQDVRVRLVKGVGQDLEGNQCKPFEVIRSLRDYSKPNKTSKDIWHLRDNYKNHVAPAAREMNTVSGKGVGGSVSGNIEWTLLRYPNHHDALNLVARYYFVIKEKPRHTPLARPPECYLNRALSFKTKDTRVWIIYGNYLYKREMYEKSVVRYKEALKISPNYAEAHYNVGLVYFKMGQYEDALASAKEAYALEFPLPGLRRMLQEKGYELPGDM